MCGEDMITKKIARRICLLIIALIKYMPFAFALKLRRRCYGVVLKRIGRHSNITDGVTITNPSKVSIGDHVSIHEYSVIGTLGEVTIGDYTLIAPGCMIFTDTHNYSLKDTPIRKQGCVEKPVVIGNDVWLGTHVTVLGGVTIGDGAVIGAGSVVNRDIPPYAIAVGVPCRVKKVRYEK